MRRGVVVSHAEVIPREVHPLGFNCIQQVPGNPDIVIVNVFRIAGFAYARHGLIPIHVFRIFRAVRPVILFGQEDVLRS